MTIIQDAIPAPMKRELVPVSGKLFRELKYFVEVAAERARNAEGQLEGRRVLATFERDDRLSRNGAGFGELLLSQIAARHAPFANPVPDGCRHRRAAM
jgi:hypothetical protein